MSKEHGWQKRLLVLVAEAKRKKILSFEYRLQAYIEIYSA
jgi:hypothetical protein